MPQGQPNPPLDGADLCWCGDEPMHPRRPSCHESAGVALAERNPLCECHCAVPTILYDGRQWCDRCVPKKRTGHAVGIHSIPIRDDSAALRELIPALTKAVDRLCSILEAIALRGLGGGISAPAAPAPIASGDRITYKGRRGMVRSVGAAGTGVLFDDGRYELLLTAQAARLVRA